jgi:hypothetical protein
MASTRTKRQDLK